MGLPGDGGRNGSWEGSGGGGMPNLWTLPEVVQVTLQQEKGHWSTNGCDDYPKTMGNPGSSDGPDSQYN